MLRGLISLSLVGAAVAVPSLGHSEYVAELDVDGQLGNGPDTVSVGVGQEIWTSVWLHGPQGLFGFEVVVCNPDHSLQYASATYNVPESWTMPPGWPPYGCGDLWAIDFTFSQPIALSWKIGEVRFVAALDQSLAILNVILEESGWLSTGYATGHVDDYVGAVVQVGSTATDESSWGAIKTLFR